MTITVYSYTTYHSPNAYLGTVLLRRALTNLPGVKDSPPTDLHPA